MFIITLVCDAHKKKKLFCDCGKENCKHIKALLIDINEECKYL
jgi:hypothetical protein